jgi:hypothetical protein
LFGRNLVTFTQFPDAFVVPVPHQKKRLKCRQLDIAKDRRILRVFAALSDIPDQLVTV